MQDPTMYKSLPPLIDNAPGPHSHVTTDCSGVAEQCTQVYRGQCTVFSVQCIVQCVQCTVCTVQCPPYKAYKALCSAMDTDILPLYDGPRAEVIH